METQKMRIVRSEELGEDFYSGASAEELPVVRQVLDEVRKEGDRAVAKYTERFDGEIPKRLEVTKDEIAAAYKEVDRKVLELFREAAGNIRSFAEKQLAQCRDLQTEKEGVLLGQRVIPLSRVGCYVPGGRYPLPSTALMTIIPAKVAGVKEVIVCSPKTAPATIVAADIAGADRIFRIGGIQAIGAMAYGTASVPKVDKIVGPGNRYVAEAKRAVYGTVGIDFVAGPSEVLIIADGTGDPELIAADLLAQAEHDPLARVDLVTTSEELAARVNDEIAAQLQRIRTRKTAAEAIERGSMILARDREEMLAIADRRVPEHLELQVKDPEQAAERLVNYGSLFIGEGAAEVFGDYCSGINHVLPTGGAARYAAGLSVRDFLRFATYMSAGKAPEKMAKTAAGMATIEGLDAHRNAAMLRLKKR